jgi:hypothetical protein
VHLVDDDHAVAPTRGREAYLFAKLLDVGDSSVGSAIDLLYVERDPGRDVAADVAVVAGLVLFDVGAVT